MNVGTRIRERREELGMSQDELAKRAGYAHRATISKIENGYQDFPIDQIVPIAKALDVTPGWIMGWDKPDTGSDKTAQRLMAYAKKMNGLQLSEWIDYAEKLLNEETPG